MPDFRARNLIYIEKLVNNQIMTNRQVFFVVFLSIIGAGEAINIAHSANFLGILQIAFLFLITLVVFASLSKRFHDCSFRDYAPKIFGKFFGWILNFACLVIFSLALIFFIKQCVAYIQDEFLQQTPFWIIALVLIFIFHYASSKGLTNIGRLSEFLGLIILLAVIFAIAFMLMSKNFGGINFVENAKRGSSIYLFASSLIILIVPIKKVSGAVWGYFVALLTTLLLFIATLIVISPSQVEFFNNPLFAAIRETKSPQLQLLARLDSLFIMLWLFASFCRGAIFKHAIDVFANAALPQRMSRRWSFLALSAIIFVAAIWHQPIVLGSDSKDIQNKSIVSAIAASEKDGKYFLMFEIDEFSGDEISTIWLIGEGANEFEAREDAQSQTEKEFYFDSARAVVLDDSMDAKRMAENLRDDNNYRKNMVVFQIDDISKLQDCHFVGKFLEKAEKNPVTFLDILSGDSSLPIIKVEDGRVKAHVE